MGMESAATENAVRIFPGGGEGGLLLFELHFLEHNL